jgi:SAM-dependent methyltransferase
VYRVSFATLSDLINRFGKESFDVVISTELLEHVCNWRNAVSNLKNILRPNGALLITTRSKGFGYHGYPFDFWRYEVDDMKVLFSDLSIEAIDKDPLDPGVFVKARKPDNFTEMQPHSHELYSVIRLRRCKDIRDFNIYVFRAKWDICKFLLQMLPGRLRTILRNAVLRRWEV